MRSVLLLHTVHYVYTYLACLGSLCESDLNLLSSWRPSLKEEHEKLLVESGRKELRQIGARFSKRLPDIFEPEKKGIYNVSARTQGAKITYCRIRRIEFQVRHTNKERTQSSSQEFVSGAFPGKTRSESGVLFHPPVEDDPLLRASDIQLHYLGTFTAPTSTSTT